MKPPGANAPHCLQTFLQAAIRSLNICTVNFCKALQSDPDVIFSGIFFLAFVYLRVLMVAYLSISWSWRFETILRAFFSLFINKTKLDKVTRARSSSMMPIWWRGFKIFSSSTCNKKLKILTVTLHL